MSERAPWVTSFVYDRGVVDRLRVIFPEAVEISAGSVLAGICRSLAPGEEAFGLAQDLAGFEVPSELRIVVAGESSVSLVIVHPDGNVEVRDAP